MPVNVTCPDHADADVTYAGDFLMHAAVDHPGEVLQELADRCVVEFQTQNEARGVVLPRRLRCRFCATEVVTDDPTRLPYCDEHLEGL